MASHDDTQVKPDDDVHEPYYSGLIKMEDEGLVDISSMAYWTVSSFKSGFGVDELRNEDPQLYWQSDGSQPHCLDIQFSKRVDVAQVSFYVHNDLDESYTPHKVILSAGSGYYDLKEIAVLELEQPIGWCTFDTQYIRKDGLIKPHVLRIKIASNHDNGKDTHMRAVRVLAPKSHFGLDAQTDIGGQAGPGMLPLQPQQLPFTSIEFLSESVIR